MWQDFVLTGANLIFGFLLIPQLKDVIAKKQSLKLYTCGFTFFWFMYSKHNDGNT